MPGGCFDPVLRHASPDHIEAGQPILGDGVSPRRGAAKALGRLDLVGCNALAVEEEDRMLDFSRKVAVPRCAIERLRRFPGIAGDAATLEIEDAEGMLRIGDL